MELRKPQRQLPFIASLTCPRKSLARDDKLMAEVSPRQRLSPKNTTLNLSSRPKRSDLQFFATLEQKHSFRCYGLFNRPRTGLMLPAVN